jgi:hypothetical protein
MTEENEIFDGVIGGKDLPRKNIREDISTPEDLIVSSALDRRLAKLLSLHPELKVKFRNNNLASLNAETKEALLQDMQDILGITPLRNG